LAGDAGGWGIGIIVGEPLAVTAEYQVSRVRAIDMGLGYSWGHSLFVYGDYLFLFPGGLEGQGEKLKNITPYVGVGGYFASHDSSHLHIYDSRTFSTTVGVRIPLGADWYVPNSSVQIFAELVPGLLFIPGLAFEVQGGVGARYWF
jgi:hypothetical protein